MADKYVWSGATGTESGNDWTNAYTDIGTGVAALAAGDRLFVASDHVDANVNAAYNLTFAGTPTNPNTVYSCSRTTGAYTPGAQVFRSGTSSSINFSGSFASFGVDYTVGASGQSAQVRAAQSTTLAQLQVFQDCVMGALGSGSTSYIAHGTTAQTLSSEVVYRNVQYRFGSVAGGGLRLSSGVLVTVENCALHPSSVAIAAFSRNGIGEPIALRIRGLDMSVASTSASIYDGTGAAVMDLKVDGVVMPSGWTGAPLLNTPLGDECLATNVSAGNTNYEISHQNAWGRTVQDTGVYLTGGMSDGTTPMSWKVVTNTGAKWPSSPYKGPESAIWCDVTTAKTYTFELVTDNVDLTDQDFGIECTYFANGTNTLKAVDSTVLEPFGSWAVLTTSTASWTGTGGFTLAKKYKIAITITAGKKGPILFRPVLLKASTTVYFDADPTVT